MTLYLGIDGGGTKTEACLVDEHGAILSIRRSGASAIVGMPHREALDTLINLKAKLLREVGAQDRDIVCGLGLSGIDFSSEIPRQHAILCHELGFAPEKLQLVNDAIIALWGATASPSAVLLQHGTCFTSAYRQTPGEEALFDHLGICRCFDMREAFLIQVARAIAGMSPMHEIHRRFLDHLDIPEEEFPERCYRHLHKQGIPSLPRDKMADLPRMLYEAWADADPHAGALVDASIVSYTEFLQAMLSKVEQSDAIAILGGGVIDQAPEELWRLIQSRLGRVPLQVARFRPCIGASIMAAHGIGNTEVQSKLFRQSASAEL